MAFTLAEAQTRLAEYRAAETRALQSQEARLGGPGLDRWDKQAELDQIRKGIKECQREIDRLSNAAAGLPRFGGITFSSARFNT